MSIETENKSSLIDDFSFDDDTSFSFDETVAAPVVETETPEETLEEKPKEETPAEDKKPAEETPADDPDAGFDFDTPEPEGEEPKDDEDEDITEDEELYTNITSDLIKNGIFEDPDIEEDEVISKEKFLELQEAEVDKRVDETFEGFFEGMDEEGKAFLKHKKDGGSTEDFFKVYGKSVTLPSGDIEDVKTQEAWVRYYLKVNEEETDEEIDDKIEWLTENGKLEATAKRYEGKSSKAIEAEKKALAAQAKAANERAAASVEEFKTELVETLTALEDLKGFAITTKESKDLVDFITKPSVKTGKNKFSTGIQSELGKLFADKDKTNLLLLSKLLKNNFDFSEIASKEKQETIKEVKKKFKKKKDSKPNSSGSTRGGRSLDSYF